MPTGAEHRFPCAQCGGDYRFDPTSGTLLCAFCGSQQPLASAGPWGRTAAGAGVAEIPFDTGLAEHLPADALQEARVSHCPNCGGDVVFDGAEHAAECPFCTTPVVLGTARPRQIKPGAVLPFALDDEAARTAMTAWLGRLWFAPNGLQRYARKGRPMQGIYVPYWTFDAQSDTQYRGQRGTVYYETRSVVIDGKRQQRQVPRVRWAPVARRVARFFDDVLVLASGGLPAGHMQGLAPWDLSGLQPYQPHYLAGFRAEAYTLPLDAGFQQARQDMAAVISRDIRFDIGGDRQQIDHVDTRLSDVTFKHVLLPVWVAAYQYRGKTYQFVVNGHNGRVQGQRPWSVWKLAFALGFGAVVAAALGYGLAQGG